MLILGLAVLDYLLIILSATLLGPLYFLSKWRGARYFTAARVLQAIFGHLATLAAGLGLALGVSVLAERGVTVSAQMWAASSAILLVSIASDELSYRAYTRRYGKAQEVPPDVREEVETLCREAGVRTPRPSSQ